MKICGFNKTTLLDYPGKVAATVFLGGCNYRCPFCQNSPLVTKVERQPEYSREEILSFLKKRRGILDGVCISGGEPTLSPELPDFLLDIRRLGYEVKLDTNGSRPSVIKELFQNGLIQKVAMDIKACPENYGPATGLPSPDLSPVLETADFLLNGTLDYEFRTTVVKELHGEKDFKKIGRWLAGAKAYFLQAYRDSEEVLVPGFSCCSPETLKRYRQILLRTIPAVEIRGIDLD
ncbi:MAG: anaerobic ribonucleoside-triphosphate reductase activating protein [Clostridiales bacterium]|nr:anaerobic ribonucleoside-triphosphate reductase activating protein [Clostridiales bacterium]